MNGAPHCLLLPQQSLAAHAQKAATRDDDVIVNGDVEWLACGHQLSGNRNIMAARRGVSARVIMDKDQRSRIQIECVPDHFSRVDLHSRNGALPHDSISQKPVVRIEKQHAKHFARQMGHVVMEVCEKFFGCRHDGAGQGFAPQDPAQCARQVSQQVGNVCGPARHLRAIVLKAFEHARQCSECINQAVAEVRCTFADQTANEACQNAFILVQFGIRLRDLFVATTRMISCR